MWKLERNVLRVRRERIRRRNLRLVLAAAVLLVLCIIVLLSLRSCGGTETDENGSGSASSGRGSIVSGSSSRAAVLAAASPAHTPSAAPSKPASSAPEEAPQLSDPLLVLVNDKTPLPENWPMELKTVGDSAEQVNALAYDDLMAMFTAAGEEEIWFWVASGYRSVETQEEILEQGIQRRMNEKSMTREEAEADALRTINRPGYSEHHTGLAVDFNDVSDGFEESEAYRWLCDHAAEYGFVQRYRQDKAEFTGIDNESWHYRYVGREHAQEMARLDMCLEEYVEWLKAAGN